MNARHLDFRTRKQVGKRKRVRSVDQAVDDERPCGGVEARNAEVAQDDHVLAARDAIAHLMRRQWQAAKERMRIELRPVHEHLRLSRSPYLTPRGRSSLAEPGRPPSGEASCARHPIAIPSCVA